MQADGVWAVFTDGDVEFVRFVESQYDKNVVTKAVTEAQFNDAKLHWVNPDKQWGDSQDRRAEQQQPQKKKKKRKKKKGR